MQFGSPTCALFIFLDYQDALRAHWIPHIFRAMSATPDRTHRMLLIADASNNERMMNTSVTAALVNQNLADRHETETLAYVIDANNVHVAGCAYELVAGIYLTTADSVVLSTQNLADYKIEELAKLGMSVMYLDAFSLSLFLISMTTTIRTWRFSFTNPPDPDRLLNRLEKDGIVEIAAALRVGAKAG